MNIIAKKPNRKNENIVARLSHLAKDLDEIRDAWWTGQPDHIQGLKRSVLRSHGELFNLHREMRIAGDKRWRAVEKASTYFSSGAAKFSQAYAHMSEEVGREGEALLGRAAKELLSVTRS